MGTISSKTAIEVVVTGISALVGKALAMVSIQTIKDVMGSTTSSEDAKEKVGDMVITVKVAEIDAEETAHDGWRPC